MGWNDFKVFGVLDLLLEEEYYLYALLCWLNASIYLISIQAQIIIPLFDQLYLACTDNPLVMVLPAMVPLDMVLLDMVLLDMELPKEDQL